MGSNMAENHPVGFQWVVEARERGAKVIHVDPRFTRTSAMATQWVGIRAGSDIAFLGGIVNYILEHDRWFKEYVVDYTNAPVIVREDFQDTEELDGLFSGWNAVGWTQHTVGVQLIRTASIIQLLLGNIGRPGGGILALRGHASIQGSTDIPTLYDILPGYLTMPHVGAYDDLDHYIEANKS